MNDYLPRTKTFKSKNMIDPNELQNELKNFYGSETRYQYTFLWVKLYYSEGCHFLFQKSESFWLINLIASWQDEILDTDKDFQVWELKQMESKSWVITCTDGNMRILCKQEIEYSDFPITSGFKIWVVDRMLMLPSEY